MTSSHQIDPKALKCVFFGYSRLQKSYQCYSPDLYSYLVSTDVVFSEHIPFFSALLDSCCKGEDDDWLSYQVFLSVSVELTLMKERTNDDNLSISAESSNSDTHGVGSSVERLEEVIIPQNSMKPPIVQVYTRRTAHHDTCLAPALLSSDPPSRDLDLPTGLFKGICKYTLPKYPIVNFVSYDHLSSSSSSLIASLDSISIPKRV
jgi:hypothetical protein